MSQNIVQFVPQSSASSKKKTEKKKKEKWPADFLQGRLVAILVPTLTGNSLAVMSN
jgi:hypothetical protein